MGLQSIQYLVFLVVVAAAYLHMPHRAQAPFLLVASWVFYAMAPGHFLPVTLAIAAFSYLCGLGIGWKDGAHKTAFVRLGVIGSLVILAFFKYGGALEQPLHLPFSILMPLGISFYSFAAISCLIDAGRGDCAVVCNPVSYALFLTFFATVTQGPIPRAGQLVPQLEAEHRFDADRTVRALRLYALGLFKMVSISDVLGVLVDQVFADWHSYGGGMLLLAAVWYTFQLYFNFSGYSDLARATGLVLGLNLSENFKTPFFATTFSGFWSRWHISFSSWLQDYLFMPLAWADTERLTGGRLRRLPPELCVFLVFFVSGFWHGNTLPFVVWGLLQALYRVGEDLLHRTLGKPKKKAPPRILWGKRAVVFVLWTLSMVFFRMGSGSTPGTVYDCFRYLAGIGQGLSAARFAKELYAVAYNGFYANPMMVGGYYAFALLALAVGIWLDHRRCFVHRNHPSEEVLAALPGWRRQGVYLALIILIWIGYILQGGGFGGTAGFGMYANF